MALQPHGQGEGRARLTHAPLPDCGHPGVGDVQGGAAEAAVTKDQKAHVATHHRRAHPIQPARRRADGGVLHGGARDEEIHGGGSRHDQRDHAGVHRRRCGGAGNGVGGFKGERGHAPMAAHIRVRSPRGSRQRAAGAVRAGRQRSRCIPRVGGGLGQHAWRPAGGGSGHVQRRKCPNYLSLQLLHHQAAPADPGRVGRGLVHASRRNRGGGGKPCRIEHRDIAQGNAGADGGGGQGGGATKHVSQLGCHACCAAACGVSGWRGAHCG
mmetsp:Transcript_23565/g.39520  ORF Transcript_23565/g.39520 Transcript_23565/m.39520 type:complete len:268 (-) Transcript_23565:3836-4639(-)